MPRPATIRSAGRLAAILILPSCAAGTSWAADQQVINGQLQLGEVFSNQSLNVQDASDGVSGAATAVGNIVSAIGQAGAFDAQSDQAVAGKVESSLSATVNGSSGPYFATSADATGNSATLGACCAATTGSSLQAIEDGGVVAADATSTTYGPAGGISVDTSAVGSTTGWEQNGGSIQVWTGQTNAGLTTTSNTGSFAGSDGNVGLSATAVGNNVTGDLADATIDLGAGQDLSGPGVNSTIDVTVGYAGDLQALATGVGNNFDVQAQGPQTDVNVQQSTSGPVNAYANVQLGSWTGDANVSAYGVGNSAVISNSGARFGVWSNQSAGGDVDATASFTGGAGGAVYASSTAMGNAVSAYPCQACGGDFAATNNQVASGRVRSNTVVTVNGRARAVAADSVAIGNSATYVVQGSGN